MTGPEFPASGPADPAPPAVGTEIERKFLLLDTGIAAGLAGQPMVQGYFADIAGWSVRLRTAVAADGGARAWLTLKSQEAGAARREIEVAVAYDFAGRMLASLPPDSLISKIRYRLPQKDAAGRVLVWEIDRFLERHHGLWLAEIELPRLDYPVRLPAWIGAEVTDDPRYRNSALARAGNAAAVAPPPAELVAT
ncbi:hypothetical protein, partial [Ferrovibrio sp.]